LVSNLARPTGNITGVSLPDLFGKRIEILKEALPNLSRVVVLVNAIDPVYVRRYVEAVEGDARSLGLDARVLEVNGAGDLDRAFSAITPDTGTGVVAAADVMFYVERKRMADLALARRLPAVFHNEEFARSGGFMTYGPSVTAVYRRAGAYVDKIIKGAKPSDLPIELPTLYRFFINLKTANALGLNLPPTLLTRADEVIE
jgi:putative ABC transport system substrate-binding protein